MRLQVMFGVADDERDELNALSNRIIGAALRVHTELGPGLLESAYEVCLAFELADEGCTIERQVSVPIVYRRRKLVCGYRIDLLVERKVIVEVKAVDRLTPVHMAQLLSQLRLKDLKLGLLINFHVKSLRDGVRRVVNGFPD